MTWQDSETGVIKFDKFNLSYDADFEFDTTEQEKNGSSICKLIGVTITNFETVTDEFEEDLKAMYEALQSIPASEIIEAVSEDIGCNEMERGITVNWLSVCNFTPK